MRGIMDTYDGVRFLKVTDEWVMLTNQLKKYNIVDIAFVTFVKDPVVSRSVCPVLFYDQQNCMPLFTSLKGTIDETNFDLITVSPALLIMANKPFMRDMVMGNIKAEFVSQTYLYSPSLIKVKLDNGLIGSAVADEENQTFNLRTTMGEEVFDGNSIFDISLPKTIPFSQFDLLKWTWSSRSVNLLFEVFNKRFEVELDGKTLYDNLDKVFLTEKKTKIFPDMIKQKPEKVFVYSRQEERVVSTCLELIYKNTIHFVFYAYYAEDDNV